jgi:hypothetical protein
MAALMGVGVAELVDRTCQRTGSKVCLAAADGVISH